MKTGARPHGKSRAAASLPAAITIRALIQDLQTARALATIQRHVYPKKMQESARAIYGVLASTDLSRGLFSGPRMIGYILFQRSGERRTVYVYDVAVLPRHQHRGLGTRLVQEALRSVWQRGLTIRLHVRSTSYPLFVSREKLRAAGYKLASKKFVPDFYFGEFGVHEDAHELVLQRLPHKPSVQAQTG